MEEFREKLQKGLKTINEITEILKKNDIDTKDAIEILSAILLSLID